MKFPNDVFNNKETKQTVYRNSPAYVIMFIIGFILIVGAVLATPILSMQFGLPLKFNLTVSIILTVLLCIYVARKMILREPEKLYELKNNLTNSLMKYFRLNLAMEDVETTERHKVEYTLFEHYNGVPFFMFQLKFGSNRYSRESNLNLLIRIFNILGKSNLEFVKITTLEQHHKHEVWDYWSSNVSKLDQNKFKVFVSHIIKFLRTDHNRVKVPTIYIKVNVKSSLLRYKINDIVEEIYREFEKSTTNFREIYFFTYKDMIDLLKEYHYLENVDISLSQALDDVDLKVGKTEVIWVKDKHDDYKEKRDLPEFNNRNILFTAEKEDTTYMDDGSVIEL